MPDVYATNLIKNKNYQVVKLGLGPPGTSVDCSVPNPLPTRDPKLDLARDLVPGLRTVVIRGHNPSQTNVSGFVDIAENGDLAHLIAAENINIVSTSTADTNSPPGLGLRTILIEGVDNTGAEVSEVLALNGTTPVQTINSYLRVNSMLGLTVGAAGWNVGSIIATSATSTIIQDKMDDTEGISQGSHYTVPLGKTLYITQLELNIAKTMGGSFPVVEFKLYCRTGGVGACWVQLFDKKLDSAVTNEMNLVLPFPSNSSQATARTDIRMRADTDQNNTEVRTRLYGILVDD